MDKYVCSECVNDPVLAEIVERSLADLKMSFDEEDDHVLCSYCGVEDGCPLADVAEYVKEIVERDYSTDKDEHIPYDQEVGCYWGDPELSISDILNNFDFKPSDEQITFDIEEYLGHDTYVDIDRMCGSESWRSKTSWDAFVRHVKHRRRFTFWSQEEDVHMNNPTHRELLGYVVEVMANSNLIRELDAGSRFWRVRIHEDTTADTPSIPSGYASVPDEKAVRANRMSPPGISMFYGAATFETACVETVDINDPKLHQKVVSGIQFGTVNKLRVLDFTAMAHPRSEFEPWRRDKLERYRFLKSLLKDFRKRVPKDEKHHVEYIPTQVFTEYIRYEYRNGGSGVDGIIYPSSVNDQKCIVLFATHDQCGTGGHNQLLEGIDGSFKMAPATDVTQMM